MGPIARAETREQCVARQVEMMRLARSRGADLVVFPELALTTFFPALVDGGSGRDRFVLRDGDAGAVDTARCSSSLPSWGSASTSAMPRRPPRMAARFNTSILVDKSGGSSASIERSISRAMLEHEPERPFQHLEKRYFEVGDLGFPVFDALGGRIGMCICNDRRWPETYRVMGLQGVELVLLGYNTPWHYPPVPAARSSAGLPQPPLDAGRRLSERHLGRRRCQMWRRGRLSSDRAELHHRPDRRDRGDVHHARG